jgi:hypothetical protein
MATNLQQDMNLSGYEPMGIYPTKRAKRRWRRSKNSEGRAK